MPSLDAVRESNALFSPSYLPVIVVIGGTSGIGEAVTRAFAGYTGGKAHIIIIGRNRAAAESIIASLPKPSEPDVSASGWKHEFVECDVSLMKSVHATTNELLSRLSRINFLVLSAGVLSWVDRDDTIEGLDRRLAIRYYSRWLFTNDLLPLLQKAKDSGEQAGVLSIMGSAATRGTPVDEQGQPIIPSPGILSRVRSTIFGPPSATPLPTIDADDLGFRKSPSAFKIPSTSGTYNDLAFDTFADQNPTISFTHIIPGIVSTPNMGLKDLPRWYLKPVEWIINPLLHNVLAKSADDCAQHMLYALLNADQGSISRNSLGDLTRIAKSNPVTADAENDKKVLWDHTRQAVNNI